MIDYSSGRPTAAVVTLAIVCVCAYPGASGIAPAHQEVRTLPSPAQLALLVTDFNNEALATLRRAITADPLTRVVAARLAAKLVPQVLVSVVEQAWRAETDDAAAAEQVRTIVAVRGADAIDGISARLAEAGPLQIVAFAESLSRLNSELLATRLPDLAARLGQEREDLVDAVLVAFRSNEHNRDRLARAWLAIASASAWSSFLDQLAIDEPGVAGIVTHALRSGNAAVREATTWNVVGRLAAEEEGLSRVLDAAVKAPDASEEVTPWERFGRNLIGRRHRRKAPQDESALIAAEGRARRAALQSVRSMRELTSAEQQALQGVIGNREPTTVIEISWRFGVWRHNRASMRTFPLLWPGFLTTLTREARCSPTRSDYAVARAIYSRNGRPTRLEVDNVNLSPECMRMMTALSGLLLADSRKPLRDGDSELLIMPIDEESVRCASDVEGIRGLDGPISPDAAVKRPSKIRDVRPDYPPYMQLQGIQGVVVLEILIAKSGCVAAATILRSIMPALDYSALRAVTKWRFERTTLNGAAVPVIMTVAVNFQLQ